MRTTWRGMCPQSRMQISGARVNVKKSVTIRVWYFKITGSDRTWKMWRIPAWGVQTTDARTAVARAFGSDVHKALAAFLDMIEEGVTT